MSYGTCNQHAFCVPFRRHLSGRGFHRFHKKSTTHNHLKIKRAHCTQDHDFYKRRSYFPDLPNFIDINIREMTKISWRILQLDDTINAFTPYLRTLLTARPFKGIFRPLIRSRHPNGVITSHCRSNSVPLQAKIEGKERLRLGRRDTRRESASRKGTNVGCASFQRIKLKICSQYYRRILFLSIIKSA